MTPTHLNKVIQCLVDNVTVFSTQVVGSGNYSELSTLATSDFDMVIIENEHRGFDFPTLRHSFQYLLHRERIAERGLIADPTPFVRIPVYGRELAYNHWVLKQTLDCGAYGLVLPHLDTVEGALAAVEASRFPPRPANTYKTPEGLRGWSNLAADYWGISDADYYDRADVWPLNPAGDLLLVGIVENIKGIENLSAILRQTKGIGLIWAGQGDLSASMGFGDMAHPEVEAAALRIRDICKQHGVACAASVTRNNDAATRVSQGFEVVLCPPAQLAVARKAAGRT